MKMIFSFIAIVCASALALADGSTANVKVGIDQGGDHLFVKSGGTVNIQAGGSLTVASASPFRVDLVVTDVRSTNVVAPIKTSPIAGSVSSVVCVNDAVIGGTGANAILKAKINGALITNGSVTISSSSAAYNASSATPTAANTVTTNSLLSIETDGGGVVGVGPSPAAKAACSLFISP